MRFLSIGILINSLLTGVAAFAEAPVANQYIHTQDTIISDTISDLIRLVNGNVSKAPVDSFANNRFGSAVDVLDLVSKIYEDNDYYSSGNWGITTDVSNVGVYVGTLPPYASKHFTRPVPGGINSHFGLRPQTGRMHKGIDISLQAGDSVAAALDGIVERNGYDKGGYGHFVVVSHPEGLKTIYAHLKNSLVPEGKQVRAGDIIGLGGSSGNSSGPHLHFEIRYHGKIVDPTFLVNQVRQ